MQTKTERLIRHKRKRGGILVPMIEDFMRHPVNIEDADDVNFISALAEKMAMREERRDTQTVFSPSALGECLRRAYLAKNHESLGLVKVEGTKVEPNYYFLNGNFLHIKWQFVLYKMMKAGVNGLKPLELDDVEPRWCEVPILSKRQDHGGTLDVALEIFEVPMFSDFKGLNVRTFGEITRGAVPPNYEIQVADYMHLYNLLPKRPTEKITQSLLIVENKGGPDTHHHAALHEVVIELDEHKPEVKRRLEELRSYEAEKEIPPPECTSTKTFQFQGCPFAPFCKGEVKEIERRNSKSSDTQGYKVSVPGRNGNRRTRRNSK